MKKSTLFLAIVLPVAFALGACSSDEPSEHSAYTEKQQKVFALFNGTWADIQFSNLSGGQLGSLLPDPDLIVFGKHFDKEIEITRDDYMNGQEHLFFAQGECTYKNYDTLDKSYTDIDCYYYINSDADYFALYDKKTNRRHKGFDIDIQSETKIYLHDQNLSLPYIFVKQ